jgi:hypothetical protein
LLRLRTLWSGIGGTPFLTTLYFDGSTQTEADDAVLTAAAFLGNADAVIDNGLSWATEAEVVRMDPATGQPLSLFTTTPATGTGALAGNQVPFIAQALIRWRTGVFVGGKEIRGRTFLPGLQGGTADGTLSAANITTLSGAAAGLVAGVAVFGVWSKTHGQFQPAISSSVWNQFASLRTRRPQF